MHHVCTTHVMHVTLYDRKLETYKDPPKVMYVPHTQPTHFDQLSFFHKGQQSFLGPHDSPMGTKSTVPPDPPTTTHPPVFGQPS